MRKPRCGRATSGADIGEHEKWQLPREAVEEDFAILKRENKRMKLEDSFWQLFVIPVEEDTRAF